MENTPHIGILGLGSKSTVFYIEELNRRYNALKGGYSTFPFKLLNTNFNNINPFLPNQFEVLKNNLTPYIKETEKLNIEALLIPNITLHETLDMLKLKIPIIHPVKNSIELLKEKECKDVVIVGSLYSMNSSYISSQLLNENIKVSLPSADDMKFIDGLRQKIYLNHESPEEVNQYNNLIKFYASTKTVLIACTELSLIFDSRSANVYDMARIQMDKALKKVN